jgi:HTH-type transcriptional regulator, competence development regulator
VFNKDANELLIAAKKEHTDFHKVITENKNVPVFLRSASKLSNKQWEEIKKIINEEN